ncbi:sugar phosphate isomerase/epimerase family protein [Daejeonella sp. H1SJ63]|uniref:sugar phosphate isomerase/epimerase family protein n=1 Tax=Daejeonella sp. H1SJ63 TaxID=3034145 RepID=UPI0023EB2E22|nr:sugar phosphate isomerase/epimerase family protein [Daejeonella sp. H1SJ63]
MAFELGVMQGRLLPKYLGRYQAHPLGYWQDEFKIAADLNLSCIEFILDFNDADQNPLLSSSGVDEILKITQKTGIKVLSVCADYFMEAPIHNEDKFISANSKKILSSLLDNCYSLGVRDIVIPCVDQSSLGNAAAVDRLIINLDPLIEKAENLRINLSLETDLNPYYFATLLDKLPSEYVTVNYDTGNSASLGYNPIEEFECYGSRISDIHIKDRKLGGGSVVLGTGDTDFNAFFKALGTIDYQGPIIMQAYRDDEGRSIFKQQLDWFKNNYLNK